MTIKFLLEKHGELIGEFFSEDQALEFYEKNIYLKEDDRESYTLNSIKDGEPSNLCCPYYLIKNQPSSLYKQAKQILDILEKINSRLSCIEDRLESK